MTTLATYACTIVLIVKGSLGVLSLVFTSFLVLCWSVCLALLSFGGRHGGKGNSIRRDMTVQMTFCKYACMIVVIVRDLYSSRCLSLYPSSVLGAFLAQCVFVIWNVWRCYIGNDGESANR